MNLITTTVDNNQHGSSPLMAGHSKLRCCQLSTVSCQLSTITLAFILATAPLVTSAQRNRDKSDTIPTVQLDSLAGLEDADEVVRIKKYTNRFDPQKAMLYSAVFPGLGQIYNKAAWKAPIIWGGFVVMGFGIKYYQDGYVLYKDLLYEVLNEPFPVVVIDPDTGDTAGGNRLLPNGALVPYPVNLGVATLRQRVQRYQRDRDFAVMLTAVWYVLQMVEAHVDAHLKEFKVNPQLQVMVEPAMESNYLTGRTNGLSLKLKF
jgi:hypothetical protein